MPVIPAAGTVPWRRRRGALEVAVVHRPKYDDWSWAKGKLEPGELAPVAAVRETLEETGLEVHLGLPLPSATYTVLDRAGLPCSKEVHYWAAEVVGGSGVLENEIDEVAWLDVVAAHHRLDYARDRDQLRALMRADADGVLSTWPVALVRHSKAHPRAGWTQADRLRPLDERGVRQAAATGPLLGAYGVTRLVSSPAVRCVDTFVPYATAIGAPVKLKEGLSEEGYLERPDRAAHHLQRTLERGRPCALCSHGPVLPALLAAVGEHVDVTSEAGQEAAALVAESALQSMGKGEVLVCHVVSTGSSARVVAAERHRT